MSQKCPNASKLRKYIDEMIEIDKMDYLIVILQIGNEKMKGN
jgi:hypothetical protein